MCSQWRSRGAGGSSSPPNRKFSGKKVGGWEIREVCGAAGSSSAGFTRGIEAKRGEKAANGATLAVTGGGDSVGKKVAMERERESPYACSRRGGIDRKRKD